MKVKTSKGITLIALIITIIVLLILAGVTIASLTGENGLLNKATTAREVTEKAEMDEKIKLAVLAAIGTDGKVNLAEVKEELDNQGVEGTIEDGTLKVTTDNKEYTISENGTIGEETINTPGVLPTENPGTEEPTVVEVTGVTLNKEEIALAKGEQETLEVTIIPENATNKEVTWTSSNESVATVENGVVTAIAEGTATITVKKTSGEKTASCEVTVETETVTQAKAAMPEDAKGIMEGTTEQTGIVMVDKNDNEWVWIEVPETVFTTATSNTDYDNIKTDLIAYATDYRGSYSDTYYSGCGISSATEYTTLYNTMLSSVYENKGFYISRYEIGDSTATANNTTRTKSTGVTNTPVSKVDQIPYNYVTCSQAQGLASSMKTGEKTSSLLFGIQWDLVCKYLEVNGNWDTTTNTASYYIKINSTSWGNYSDSTFTINSANAKKYSAWSSITGEKSGSVLLTAGASEYTNKMNIYDFAGNEWEWTLEKNTSTSDPCASRGGYYSYKGSGYPASYRSYDSTTHSGVSIGFRCSLY